MENKVKFYLGTTEAYHNLLKKDPDGLYYIDGLLYKGDKLYTRRYERVTSYPLYGQENVTYVNTADNSIKYWENGRYHDICHPVVQTLDNQATTQQLASAKAIYDCIIQNTQGINQHNIDALIDNKLGYLNGYTVKDYVRLLLDNLDGGAPAGLSTLKALADAILKNAGDISNLDTTVLNYATKNELNAHINSSGHITPDERILFTNKADGSFETVNLDTASGSYTGAAKNLVDSEYLYMLFTK